MFATEFKVASVNRQSQRDEADRVLQRVYQENPSHWPYGLTRDHFDGGLYLVKESNTGEVCGFCGWQEFPKRVNGRLKKVGYYSIGILPEYRNNGFAKAAVAKLISFKSARVDEVKALIMEHNKPSQALAKSLGISMEIKKASSTALGNYQRVPASLRLLL